MRSGATCRFNAHFFQNPFLFEEDIEVAAAMLVLLSHVASVSDNMSVRGLISPSPWAAAPRQRCAMKT
jgi:hypothetical protein